MVGLGADLDEAERPGILGHARGQRRRRRVRAVLEGQLGLVRGQCRWRGLVSLGLSSLGLIRRGLIRCGPVRFGSSRLVRIESSGGTPPDSASATPAWAGMTGREPGCAAMIGPTGASSDKVPGPGIPAVVVSAGPARS
jgi:hypothetical protein